MQRIMLLRASVERLHACLDHTGETNGLMYHRSCEYMPIEGMYVLEWHWAIHSDKANNDADSEGDAARQGLSRVGVALHQLLECDVVSRTVEFVWGILSGQKLQIS